ncbi:MAG: hypothetical protein LC745_03165, partial [Planctomycetia bacterium]|nr:hypothetical protein [Planctomycetia bacterium]
RWRSERLWSVVDKGAGRYEVQFEEWSGEHPVALEVVRGRHVSSLPLVAARTTLRLEDLAYERREVRLDLPEPEVVARPASLRSAVRGALDWETVTPLDELPAGTIRDRVKKGLRWWRQGRHEGVTK